MALERRDRVKDQTTTTGTGSVTIDGVTPTGYRTITSAHTTGATVRYLIISSDSSQWEVGEGIWTSSGTSLSRVTVFASSNSGSLVSFSGGTKTVVTLPTAQDIDIGSGVFLDKGNSSTTTQTFAYTSGSHQKVTATGNHTYGFSNWPATGSTGMILLELVNYGAFTITGPTATYIKPDGTTTSSLATYFTALAAVGGPSGFQSAGTTWMVYWTRDNGTTVYGKIL